MRFRDRHQAGEELAARLIHLTGEDLVVLGLPRGGVPVAAEVARALGAPLGVLVVRKLGVPGHEELAMGALTSAGEVIDESLVRRLGIGAGAVSRVEERERVELARRERAYGGVPVAVEGKTVVLVDDGIATGSTMLAAVRAVRTRQPSRVVVAVPTAAASALSMLRREADEVVAVTSPAAFFSVGTWYDDFRETTDDEVRELLGTNGPA